MNRLKRIAFWVLAITLVISIGGVVYLSLLPPPAGQTYTEFYVLGPEGNASGYPTNLNVSEEASVIVGISNHEREPIEYLFVLAWNNSSSHEMSIEVADEETKEFPVTVRAPVEPGVYRLQFLLYRAGSVSNGTYRTLSLRVEVSE